LLPSTQLTIAEHSREVKRFVGVRSCLPGIRISCMSICQKVLMEQLRSDDDTSSFDCVVLPRNRIKPRFQLLCQPGFYITQIQRYHRGVRIYFDLNTTNPHELLPWTSLSDSDTPQHVNGGPRAAAAQIGSNLHGNFSKGQSVYPNASMRNSTEVQLTFTIRLILLLCSSAPEWYLKLAEYHEY
jgi:hypothetical protein